MVRSSVVYPLQVINPPFIAINLMLFLNFGIHLILFLFPFFSKFFFLDLPVILSLQPPSLFNHIHSFFFFLPILNLPFLFNHFVEHYLISFFLILFLSALAVGGLEVVHEDVVEDVFSYAFQFAIAALNAGLFNLKIHLLNFISLSALI